MIFVDSNVPMYLIGAEHRNKAAARQALERLIAGQERLVTDVEVIQEIFHRFVAIRGRDAIDPTVSLLLEIADEVFEIDLPTVLEARDLIGDHSALSARDALHVAVMGRHHVRRILSFDKGFDSIPGIERLEA